MYSLHVHATLLDPSRRILLINFHEIFSYSTKDDYAYRKE